ncbi:MAG: cytochrome c [Kofleriaceae bacterium]|nr:cytochrome c [Kofleriaceae bacterium]MBP6840158.1 cytochrome c [Kofleriaceae bacterium]MBP9205880.1 cytochrome c [Kofleriaceae bacterium]
MRTALLLGLVLGGCGGGPPPPVTPVHASWAATQWAGVTLADLEEGRRLYRAKCSGCHLPVAPADVTRAAWPGHVAEMRERAHLEPTQVTLIERYLVTLAER